MNCVEAIIPLLIAFIATMQAAPVSRTDVSTIIQRSIDATTRDWKAAPEYSYSERVRADGGTKTYEVMMIAGSPYQRLTQVNGKPLTAQQQAQEQQKLAQVIAKRRSESPEDKNHRIAAYVKERQRDHLLIEQLTQAFDFTLEGEQKLGTRDVYVLRARPKAGYHPPDMQSQVLTGMQGKLWVDKNTFQWVKVEAEVIHPVTIEGFLARVEPGTRFELEKMPVDEGIWLPQHFAMKSRSKIVFVVPHKTQDDETYWDYHKTGAEQNR